MSLSLAGPSFLKVLPRSLGTMELRNLRFGLKRTAPELAKLVDWVVWTFLWGIPGYFVYKFDGSSPC